MDKNQYSEIPTANSQRNLPADAADFSDEEIKHRDTQQACKRPEHAAKEKTSQVTGDQHSQEDDPSLSKALRGIRGTGKNRDQRPENSDLEKRLKRPMVRIYFAPRS